MSLFDRVDVHELWFRKSVVGLNEILILFEYELSFSILATVEFNFWFYVRRDLLIFSEIFQSVQNIILGQSHTNCCVERKFRQNILMYVGRTIHWLGNSDEEISCLSVLSGKSLQKYARIRCYPHRTLFMTTFQLDFSVIMKSLVFLFNFLGLSIAYLARWILRILLHPHCILRLTQTLKSEGSKIAFSLHF